MTDVPVDRPSPGSGARAAAVPVAPANHWISWIALAFLTTGSVASLRAAPTMAVYGLAGVFLYCPDAVDDLRARIDEYKVDDVVKE